MRQIIMLFMIGLLVASLTTVLSTSTKPTAVAVMFWSSSGFFNFGLYPDVMGNLWKTHLNNKTSDPNWPVHASLEMVDLANQDPYYIFQYSAARVANTSLPPVSVFLFADYGYWLAPWFEQFQIPTICMALASNSLSQDVSQGVGWDYNFYMVGAPQYLYRSLADKYYDVGVKTIVTIANMEQSLTLDYDSCVRTAQELMEPRGMTLIANFSYDGSVATKEDLLTLIKLTEALDPDAVLICDGLINRRPDRFLYDLWIVPMFKELNYLPKALSVLNVFGTDLYQSFREAGIYNYMTESTFGHPKMKGIDFTEDATPYSSLFRPKNPVNTIKDQLITGSNLKGSYSSTKLFYDWFINATGIIPPYQSTAIWASLDIVEQAMWRAASSPELSADGVISGNDLFTMLRQAQAPTPFGRVIFDVNRINTEPTAVVQQFLYSSPSTEIVGPGYLATHEFVYPMPKWDERAYTWSLLKGSAKSCIAIAAACSVLLVTVMITISVHRSERDIKMLYFPHLILLILLSLIVLWALVFVWQGDVNQSQCDAYLWTIYLPASFAVHLINMKAYRLSVFLTTEDKNRMKKFTHTRVFQLTLAWVSITALLLLIAQLIDPPTASVIITDKYRPSTDYHLCRYGTTTSGILYALVVMHVLVSIICVAVVRNGMEGFKDGMVMKEAFTILFAAVIVAYIMGQLNIDTQSFYLLRTAFVGIGFTVFCFRLLVSRCVRHWMTHSMAVAIIKYYSVYREYMPANLTVSDAKVSAIEMFVNSEEGSVLPDDVTDFAQAIPGANEIQEMFRVMKDEKRSKLFREVAQKGLILENIDFLETVQDLPNQYCKAMVESSVLNTKKIHEVAEEVFNNFMKEGSIQEVNISSKVRRSFMNNLKEWPFNQPIISERLASEIIMEDLLKIGHLFDPAEREISIMLHQNIWNKFRSMETEMQMA